MRITQSLRGVLLLVLSLFPVLAVVTGAEAQRRRSRRGGTVDWCTSFDGAWVEAKERGCPVVLFFIQDGENENERMVSETFRDRSFQEVADLCVCLIASRGTAEEHREETVKTEEGERVVCKKYGTVTCLEHQEIDKEGLLAFFDGYIDTPHTIVMLPDRSIVGRYDDHVPPSDVIVLVKKALDETGAHLSRSEYLGLKGDIEEAEKFIKSRSYREAWKALEGVIKKRPTGLLLEKSTGLLDAIRKEGDESFADTEVKIKLEKYGEAVVILRKAIEVFDGTDVEKEARKRLAVLEKDPEVKRILKELEVEDKAAKLLEAAEKAVASRKYVAGADIYIQLVEYYREIPAGTTARTELKNLVTDARSATAVKKFLEGEATKRLSRADSYLGNGLQDSAIKELHKILDLFPDTEAAGVAKEKLGQIE